MLVNRRLYWLLLPGAMLLSCNSVDLSRLESSYPGISETEMKLGNRISGLMQARYRLVYDKELKEYITGIREALLENTRIDLEDGEIILINDPGVFAYSIPNGDIYLSLGMLLLANNEAEMASVIAHELGHQLLQHSKQAHELGARVNTLLGQLSMDEDASEREVFQSLATAMDYGGSRERETEADQLMVQFLARSKYPPAAAVDMFRRFYRLELEFEPASPSTLKTRVFDTHPNTRERIGLIEDWLDKSGLTASDKQRWGGIYRREVWERVVDY